MDRILDQARAGPLLLRRLEIARLVVNALTDHSGTGEFAGGVCVVECSETEWRAATERRAEARRPPGRADPTSVPRPSSNEKLRGPGARSGEPPSERPPYLNFAVIVLILAQAASRACLSAGGPSGWSPLRIKPWAAPS